MAQRGYDGYAGGGGYGGGGGGGYNGGGGGYGSDDKRKREEYGGGYDRGDNKRQRDANPYAARGGGGGSYGGGYGSGGGGGQGYGSSAGGDSHDPYATSGAGGGYGSRGGGRDRGSFGGGGLFGGGGRFSGGGFDGGHGGGRGRGRGGRGRGRGGRGRGRGGRERGAPREKSPVPEYIADWAEMEQAAKWGGFVKPEHDRRLQEGASIVGLDANFGEIFGDGCDDAEAEPPTRLVDAMRDPDEDACTLLVRGLPQSEENLKGVAAFFSALQCLRGEPAVKGQDIAVVFQAAEDMQTVLDFIPDPEKMSIGGMPASVSPMAQRMECA